MNRSRSRSRSRDRTWRVPSSFGHNGPNRPVGWFAGVRDGRFCLSPSTRLLWTVPAWRPAAPKPSRAPSTPIGATLLVPIGARVRQLAAVRPSCAPPAPIGASLPAPRGIYAGVTYCPAPSITPRRSDTRASSESPSDSKPVSEECVFSDMHLCEPNVVGAENTIKRLKELGARFQGSPHTCVSK